MKMSLFFPTDFINTDNFSIAPRRNWTAPAGYNQLAPCVCVRGVLSEAEWQNKTLDSTGADKKWALGGLRGLEWQNAGYREKVMSGSFCLEATLIESNFKVNVSVLGERVALLVFYFF